jgi:hypothetical protein
MLFHIAPGSLVLTAVAVAGGGVWALEWQAPVRRSAAARKGVSYFVGCVDFIFFKEQQSSNMQIILLTTNLAIVGFNLSGRTFVGG